MRITNGQIAGIIGLRLAGVPLVTCCKIVGAPEKRAIDMLPLEWRDYIRPRPKWTFKRLQQMRKDYVNPNLQTWQVAIRHQTTRDVVRKLAVREGWPPKKIGRPKGRGKRKIVAMLVNRGVSREQALYKTLEAVHEARV